MMIIDDVTNVVELQADLHRKQEEIEDLHKRVQESYNKLKLASIERNPEIRFSSEINKKPLKELMKTDEKRIIAGDLEVGIKRRDEEVDEESNGSLTEKFKVTREIDKMNETNKKLKFQVLKAQRDGESIPNLELEIKKLKDKVLGVTNEKENIRQELKDLKQEIKLVRQERDKYYKIIKEKNLL